MNNRNKPEVARTEINQPNTAPQETARPVSVLKYDKNIVTPIIQRAKNGEQAAFADLYEMYGTFILSLCNKFMNNNRDSGRDIAHNVWVKLHRNIAKFREESSFTSWLFRIVHNECLMHYRKRSTRTSEPLYNYDPAGNMMAEVVALKNSPGSRTKEETNRINKIAIADAKAKLPPGFRQVLELYDESGLTHQEIAKMLGISQGTSRSQLHDARRAMRELLSEGKRKFKE